MHIDLPFNDRSLAFESSYKIINTYFEPESVNNSMLR
jgi:hypothetical protein